jgi:hypothetical protein
MARRDRPICKYCLEDTADRGNPFLSPCPCKGSMKYVHFACYLRWVIAQRDSTRHICPVCKMEYTNDPFQHLEDIPDREPASIRILSSPIFAVVIFHYIIVLLAFPKLSGKDLANVYEFSILLYQLQWLCYMALNVNIKSKMLYWSTFIELDGHHLLLAHGACLGVFLYDPGLFCLAGLVSNGLLTFYWPHHVNTLIHSNYRKVDGLLAS